MSSKLGSVPLTTLTCHVPGSGAWWATCTLPKGTELPALGATTLTIGSDLTLAGSVVVSEEEAPSVARVVLHGGPGWWLPLTRAESWQSDGGVRLKTVLVALALAADESLVLPADGSLGRAYGWPKWGPAAPSVGSMVLDDLVRRGAVPTWRVSPEGPTRFDAWPSTGAADSKGRVLRREMTTGLRLVGLDNAAKAFLPGATLEGRPIARDVFRETAGELRVEAWET